jgi:hypothetical protein
LIGLKINTTLLKEVTRDDSIYNFTKENKKRILTAIKKIQNTKLIDSLIENTRERKLKMFGIPHLSSLTGVLDLRVAKEGKKIKFIPIIILSLKTHNTNDDISENQLIFQCSQEDLKKIHTSITSLTKKIKDDIFHIKQKDFGVELI